MNDLTALAQQGKINQDASIRDRQSTIVNTSISKVWKALLDMEKWPEWNQDILMDKSCNVEIGNAFEWKLSGSRRTSTIQQIKPHELLSWTTSSKGIQTIHVWKLDETEDNQTIVSVEMSSQGFSTLFFSHQKLHSTLLNWLARLKQRAENQS